MGINMKDSNDIESSDIDGIWALKYTTNYRMKRFENTSGELIKIEGRLIFSTDEHGFKTSTLQYIILKDNVLSTTTRNSTYIFERVSNV
jgi:hypothetical protein